MFFFFKFFSPTNAYAICNGADEWSKCLVATSENCSQKLLYHQCRGSVMSWVGIISGEVVGSWQVPDDITTWTVEGIYGAMVQEVKCFQQDDFYA